MGLQDDPQIRSSMVQDRAAAIRRCTAPAQGAAPSIPFGFGRGRMIMYERDEPICALCGHATFIMHRGELHCCKCGSVTTEVVTTSPRLQQLEGAFEPKS